jgi:3-hydroxybutyryl-CoA dehydrogenase
LRSGDRGATENEGRQAQDLQDLRRSEAETIVASNTSSISITRLAASTDRPERFIGMHFMNPVPLMQLVELIRGIATDDETFEAAKEFVAKLGKIAVSEDFPAFIVNRILLPMINEAIYTLYEGVGNGRGDRHRDAARRQPSDGAAGARRFHRPRHLPVDHAGAARGLADSKYRPCPLLVKYVEAGWLGRKTGAASTTIAASKPVPTRVTVMKRSPSGTSKVSRMA